MTDVSEPCCKEMRAQLNWACADHSSPSECPDSLVGCFGSTGKHGLYIHDGGSSFLEIHFCPWCGTRLSYPPIARRRLGARGASLRIWAVTASSRWLCGGSTRVRLMRCGILTCVSGETASHGGPSNEKSDEQITDMTAKDSRMRAIVTAKAGVVWLVLAAGSVANTLPPETNTSFRSFRATVKPTDGMRMGTFSIQLESTVLATVRDAIGFGEIEHWGDGGESVLWLCYTDTEAPEYARVWIESHAEMGGPEHRITGIAAQRVGKEAIPSDCPVLPPRMWPLTLSHDIGLGKTLSAVTKGLGTALSRSGSWRFVGFQGKVPGDCEGGYDPLNSLAFKVQAGRLTSILATQVTSC